MSPKFYFTGTPCKNGHIDKRYLNTGICYACKRAQNKRDYLKHSVRTKKINSKSRIKRKDKVQDTLKKWVKRNKAKSNAIKKAWKIRNREQYLQSTREYGQLKRKDPLFRVNSAISRQIWGFMKNKKSGRKWESLVGYSFEALKSHLETKFDNSMNWNNYGTIWEIDHVKPKSWFKGPDVEALVKEAWKLKNLQPLLISKNRSKMNRYEG